MQIYVHKYQKSAIFEVENLEKCRKSITFASKFSWSYCSALFLDKSCILRGFTLA